MSKAKTVQMFRKGTDDNYRLTDIYAKLPGRGHNRKQTIVADQGSTCFDDLRWKDGTAYMTFQDGYEDEVDMDRSEFMDWVESGSLGGYFNANIREPTVKK